MPLYAFISGGVIFFAAHLFSTFRKRGEGDIKIRNYRPYMGLFTLVSLVGLALFAWGWANLRPWPQLWTPPEWGRHIALSLMPFAAILISAAYLPTGYIKKFVGHPMLLAVMVWALAHLAANGDLGALLLFGVFFLYALVDRLVVAARGDRGPVGQKPTILGDMLAISVGGGAYLVIIFWLHKAVIGVSPV